MLAQLFESGLARRERPAVEPERCAGAAGLVVVPRTKRSRTLPLQPHAVGPQLGPPCTLSRSHRRTNILAEVETLAESDGRWEAWRRARPAPIGLYLDSAAAGRSSLAVLAAAADHALLEAKVGAYVAQEMAATTLSAGRGALAHLLGKTAEGVAFVESATVALEVLLAVWPFERGATIAAVPSEWGPNLSAFDRRGLRVVELPVDADGHVDLGRLERLLAVTPPSAVHITQVASHRPLVQPVAEMTAVCRAASVPLFVDAAQALGHTDTGSDADVIYATSRKWLGGPRGVGVLAVANRWFAVVGPLLVATDPAAVRPSVGELLSSRESNVAGRLGLGRAAREHLELGAPAVWGRLAAIGRSTRAMLEGLDRWEVVGPVDEPSAITALKPTCGQDVTEVRARLLHEHGIVTTAQQRFRAPREMTSPTLRISPHVGSTVDDFVQLRAALASL